MTKKNVTVSHPVGISLRAGMLSLELIVNGIPKMIIIPILYSLVVGIPSVLIYWIFVHNIIGGSASESFRLSIKCQFYGFISNAIVFLLVILPITNIPYVHAILAGPDLFHDFPLFQGVTFPAGRIELQEITLFAATQLTIGALFSTLVTLHILKKQDRVSAFLAWSGHMLVGAILYGLLIFHDIQTFKTFHL